MAVINTSQTVPNTYSYSQAIADLAADVVALRATVASLVTQLTAARVDILALRAAQAATATKLNADAGVTDTDYAAAAAATVAVPTAAPTLLTTVT